MRIANLSAIAATAALLAGCVSTYGMSAQEVAGSWVGRDVRELRSRWDLNWFGGNSPNASGEYVHSANFGTNAGSRTDTKTYVRAIGPNEYEQVEEENTTYQERSVECVIEFHADAQNRVIQRVTVDGNCDGYARSYGPAPGYRSGGNSGGTGGEVIRRL